MADADKTVFISYRRSTSRHLARAVFMDLRSHGYDVFMDVNTIDSGEFDRIILNQIAARVHFILVLSPGALDRCNEPGDWLLTEIEHAMELGRNIVPIIEEGFNYPAAQPFLVGKLSQLPRYNAVPLYHAYFEAALENLRSRFLKQPVYDIPVTPPPLIERSAAAENIREMIEEKTLTPAQQKARRYFGQGISLHADKNIEGAIAAYSQALRLNPEYAPAYRNRAILRIEQGDFGQAILDLNQAIRFNANDWEAFYSRGWARYNKGNVDGAIADYSKALRLQPNKGITYRGRGWAHLHKLDYERSMSDFDQAIALDPQDSQAHNGRASVYYHRHHYEEAIAVWDTMLELDPKSSMALNNRAEAHFAAGHYEQALADYKRASNLRTDADDMITAGLAITYHTLGQVTEAKKLWRQLIKRDANYRDVDWVKTTLRWVAPLAQEARKLVALL